MVSLLACHFVIFQLSVPKYTYEKRKRNPFQNLTHFSMDCSYWNEVRNRMWRSRVNIDDNSRFSFMDIKNACLEWKSRRWEALGVWGCVLTVSSSSTVPGFTLMASGDRLTFAQNKISYLIGFVCENSAVWKLTKFFKVPQTTLMFFWYLLYVSQASYHISKNWIQVVISFFPDILHLIIWVSAQNSLLNPL